MEVKINHLICRIKYLSGRIINKLLQENNIKEINSEQEKIIYILKGSEKISTNELSKQTGLALNSLTIMLNKMEKEGIVSRKVCPKDKRKKYIHLNEKFKNFNESIEKTYCVFDNILLKDFNEKEKENLENYLKKIISNLEYATND